MNFLIYFGMYLTHKLSKYITLSPLTHNANTMTFYLLKIYDICSIYRGCVQDLHQHDLLHLGLPDLLHVPISRGVVVITTAQIHSTKPKFRICAGLNPACGVLDILDDEDL